MAEVFDCSGVVTFIKDEESQHQTEPLADQIRIMQGRKWKHAHAIDDAFWPILAPYPTYSLYYLLFVGVHGQG